MARVICSIPLPPRPKQDRLFWNASKSGLFSIKSAYFLQLQHSVAVQVGESSHMNRERKFWKFLWSLSFPQKIKVFLWRACLGILPTNGFLCHRHMRQDGACPCCTHEMETVVHALWACVTANDVWIQSQLPVHKWDRSLHCFFDLIEYSRDHLGLDDLKFFCCIVYSIWGQRNLLVHERKVLNPVLVVDRARCFLTEYDKAFSRPTDVGRRDARQSGVMPVAGGWRPPGLGLYKVNWAIFIDLNSRHGFLGALVRDHERCVLRAMVMKLPLLPRGVHLTVGAVLHTLQFACEMGFGDIILEGLVLSFLQCVGPISAGATVQDIWLEEVEIGRAHV